MLHRAYVELHRHAGFVSFMGKLGGVGEPGGLKRQGKGQAFTGQMGLIGPISHIHSFWRICNPPVLIIRICNPIDCSLFADGKAWRFEQITNHYSIDRRIANHAETQKPPKRRNKQNAETNKTQK